MPADVLRVNQQSWPKLLGVCISGCPSKGSKSGTASPACELMPVAALDGKVVEVVGDVIVADDGDSNGVLTD
ncbi:hypothetical protein UVI_02027870 [Ustilaginoidea virens]|uniref:Uncharacterized protein n=1 Tax=Ustilaginoidea virens TaxID=1159556 RepID=A0A1B5KVF5_USTVR|nr:hypothetical protein UVI_02027870 [Ustilaginoidea virens]